MEKDRFNEMIQGYSTISVVDVTSEVLSAKTDAQYR
jgi:hypothetical protein